MVPWPRTAPWWLGGINGGTATIAGWTPGTTEYVEVVGWSASVGTTWAQFLAEFQSGYVSGLYGWSSVGTVTSGGVGTPASPPAPLFTPNGPSGIQMGVVPEPATFALIGIGGLGLAMVRRRK